MEATDGLELCAELKPIHTIDCLFGFCFRKLRIAVICAFERVLLPRAKSGNASIMGCETFTRIVFVEKVKPAAESVNQPAASLTKLVAMFWLPIPTTVTVAEIGALVNP